MTGIYGGDGDAALAAGDVPPAARDRARARQRAARALGAPGFGRAPPFVSLRAGMGALVDALRADLERTQLRHRARWRPSRAPRAADSTSSSRAARRSPRTASSSRRPRSSTAELVAELDGELAEAHAEIPYASSVVVTLGFSRADVVPLDGYGYVVPRAEGGDVLACTWSSQKWEHRAPEEAVLLRVYAGRFGGRDVTTDADDELVAARPRRGRVPRCLRDAAPVRVHRWPLGMPQYVIGHPDRLERIETALAAHPGLAVAGAAYRGVGIPDCIASGEAAAESVARALAGAGV